MAKIKKLINKYNGLPVQIKASAWFFICSLIQKAITVVSTMIFTRILTTDDYGIISIYNSWSDILYIVATLNLSTGVYNVGMTKFFDQKDKFNASMQTLALTWTFGFSIIFFLHYKYLADIIQLPLYIVIIMFATFLALPAYNLWSAKQRYENHYKALVAVTITYTISILIISIFAVLYYENKSNAKIISNAAVTLIFGGILFIRNLCIKGKKTDLSFWKFALRFNVLMIPAFLSMVILNQIDRIMISNQVGLDKAGIYSVAYSAAMFISILSTAINATYNPWLMQKIQKGKFDKVDEISKIISIFFCGGLLLFIILAPELIKFIASSEYYEAVYIVPPVAASTFFTLLYTFYCPFAQYFERMKFLVLVNIGTALLNIGLNYIGISIFGYFAAGYTTYICYLIYGWGTVLYVNKLIKKEFGEVKVYNNKFYVIVTIALSVIMVVTNYFYNVYITRYLFLVVLVFIAWKNKKIFMNLVRNLRG